MKKSPLQFRVFKLASVLALLSLLFVSSSYAGPLKVSRVTDGDTIKVRDGKVEKTIRLVGIDAPEISHKKREPSQPFAQVRRLHGIPSLDSACTLWQIESRREDIAR